MVETSPSQVPQLSDEERERATLAMDVRRLQRLALTTHPESLARTLPDSGEGPTPERLAQAGPDDVEHYTADKSAHWQAYRLVDRHPLEFLRSRAVITGDQYSAGLQFYGDWYMAGLACSGVIDPGRVIVDGGSRENMSDIAMSAATRFNRAIVAIGETHSGVLTDILITEEPLESWGRRRARQTNTKLARLAAQTAVRLSLEALDFHYHGRRDRRTRASHAPGSRPYIVNPDGEIDDG